MPTYISPGLPGRARAARSRAAAGAPAWQRRELGQPSPTVIGPAGAARVVRVSAPTIIGPKSKATVVRQFARVVRAAKVARAPTAEIVSRVVTVTARKPPALARPTRAPRAVFRPPRIVVYKMLRGRRYEILRGLGATCDPAIQSCPPLDTVPLDVPPEWLTEFRRPTAPEINEASEDASKWEAFVTDYAAQAGMAFAALHRNLLAYAKQHLDSATALIQFVDANRARLSDGEISRLAGHVRVAIAEANRLMPLIDELRAVRRGEKVVAVDVPNWRFAIVPIAELPAHATSVAVAEIRRTLAGLGAVDPSTIIIVVLVAGLLIAGGGFAWWAAAHERQEPARVDAEARQRLAAAQAEAIRAQTEIARDLTARGQTQDAAGLLELARSRFTQDVTALTTPEWARTVAEQARARDELDIGQLIKWGLFGFLAIEAIKALRSR